MYDATSQNLESTRWDVESTGWGVERNGWAYFKEALNIMLFSSQEMNIIV